MKGNITPEYSFSNFVFGLALYYHAGAGGSGSAGDEAVSRAACRIPYVTVASEESMGLNGPLGGSWVVEEDAGGICG